MNVENKLKKLIEQEGEKVIQTCCSLVRIPSENPPGDTREIAGFIIDLFRSEGIESELVAPQENMPNVVATIHGGRPGKHVIFNGHMDTFPAGDRNRWNYDPFGGVMEGGRIFGRGAADMKGGLSACVHAVILLNRIRDEIPGKVTVTCVSDEETLGPWGSQYLLRTRPDIRGDALINGEPSSLENIRVGEKGQFWYRFRCNSAGGHAAYAGLRSSAIHQLVALLTALARFAEEPMHVNRKVVSMMEEARECFDNLLCPGATDAALRASVNVGKIKGGLSVNMIAEECSAEVDFRLPPGEKGERLRNWIDKVMEGYPGCSCEEFNSYDAYLTEPDDPLACIARKTAEEVMGHPVFTTFSLGGTEARLWRALGTPSITFGPNHHNMGSPDEYIEAGELPQVLSVHALTALRFLCND